MEEGKENKKKQLVVGTLSDNGATAMVTYLLTYNFMSNDTK